VLLPLSRSSTSPLLLATVTLIPVHRLRTDSDDLMSDASSSYSASASSWYSSWEAVPREEGECAYDSSGGGASHDDGAAAPPPPPRCAARGLLEFVGVLLAGDEGAALVGLAPTTPPLAVDIGEEAEASADWGSPDRKLRLWLLVGDGILLTPNEPDDDDDAAEVDDDAADDLDASRSLKSVTADVTCAVATLLPTSSAGLALSPTAGGGTRPFFSESFASATPSLSPSPSTSTAALSPDATAKVHLAADVGDVAGSRAAAAAAVGACLDFFLFFLFFFLLFPFDGVPAAAAGAATTAAAGDAALAGPSPCASVPLAPGAASCRCRPSFVAVLLGAFLSERSGPPAALS
jgi:hypothetical protein